MYAVLLPPDVNPITINKNIKYIYIYLLFYRFCIFTTNGLSFIREDHIMDALESFVYGDFVGDKLV